MQKVRIFPSLKKKEARRQTAFPDTLCGVVVATGCNIIRRRVASIGDSVFSSPAGRMEVRPNEDGAVSRMPFWYECLGAKPGCVWRWTPWFWVWGRGDTVREVREARQRLVWRCHSGRSASFWWRALVSGLRSGYGSSSRASKNYGCKIRMIWGREVKQLCVMSKWDHYFLGLYKYGWVIFNTIVSAGTAPLCQQIIWRLCWCCRWKPCWWWFPCFCLKGSQAPLWVKNKNLQPVDVMKPFQTHIWKNTRSASSSSSRQCWAPWEADRFYPSSLAFHYWYSAPTAM